MLKTKLVEISSLLNSCETKRIGLLSGLSGINLALATLKFENYESAIKRNLQIIISEIENGFSSHNYSFGISGFLWSLKYLIKQGILDKKDCTLFNQFYSFLNDSMTTELDNLNWDFLNGAIGIGMFLLADSDTKKSRTIASIFIDRLEKICIYGSNGTCTWKAIEYTDIPPAVSYNFGLAHGIPSILSFLVKACKQEINVIKSKRLVEGGVKYLIENQNDITKVRSYFPSWIREGTDLKVEKFSRLAWCYGDLGVAITLYNAAKYLNDSELEKFALKVFIYNSHRRNLNDEFFHDACLCHGTAGIATIYYRMYWNTHNESFKETASYWFDKTIEMSKYSDGLAGYKSFHTIDYGGLQNDYGLLEGISGIGLAIHSWITQTEPKWDECLLLS